MTWEEMQEIELPSAQTALYEYDWLVADLFARCSAEALAGAGEEEFKWAMSVRDGAIWLHHASATPTAPHKSAELAQGLAQKHMTKLRS